MTMDAGDALLPTFLKVARTRRETRDAFTFELEPASGSFAFEPGQFNMLYAYGVGEVPISISGDPARPGRLVHTIREVGAVTRGLGRLGPGDFVGVRGPFGTPWPIVKQRGRDVVVVAGGIGLAPLRPVIYEVLKHRSHYRRFCVVYGARSPGELLFKRELERWAERRDLQFDVTVDHADAGWTGTTGVVTRLLSRLYARPERAAALVCGPEIMMRFVARDLVGQGFDAQRVFLSAERNMQCSVGSCGRCQVGPYFVCKDGPVFRYDKIRDTMAVREL